MKTIRAYISKDGNGVKFEVDGVVGPGCEELTSNLERAVGVVISSEKKPEYYEHPRDRSHERYEER